MSKIAMLYLLTALTGLNAGIIESEIGINIGLNATKNEDGNKFKNPTVGLTYQDNKYVVSPRVDIDYTKVNNDYASSLVKVSVNGVYEYENNTYTVPYALAGVGYEYVDGATKDVFESHSFVQAGAGVRVDLEQGFKVRVEGKVLQVLGGNDEGNEFVLTAGISMPLSRKPVKPVVRPRVIRRAKPVKRKIRVVNSNMNECSIKISAPDLDRDGVPNNIDQCPATPCSFTVDNYGCPVKTTLKINFASNSAQIRQSSKIQIDQFAQYLLKNKGSTVKVIGHTDSRGSALHNLALSQRRANSIVHALLSQGVSSARLQALGKGESMPLTSNDSAMGRAMNRRIEAELFYIRRRR
jgi:OOP family OmpA-OmpF porin